MASSYFSIDLEREFLDRAFEQSKALPVFENSHRGPDANYIGCIGELLVLDYLTRNGVRIIDNRKETTHDFTAGVSNYTVDVKTKDRTVAPKSHYENSVPMYNHEHQRPDFYYFVSLFRPESSSIEDVFRFEKAFIVGGIDLQTLDRVGKHWEKDQVDPRNGMKFWTSCINVSMAQIKSNKEMIEEFSK